MNMPCPGHAARGPSASTAPPPISTSRATWSFGHLRGNEPRRSAPASAVVVRVDAKIAKPRCFRGAARSGAQIALHRLLVMSANALAVSGVSDRPPFRWWSIALRVVDKLREASDTTALAGLVRRVALASATLRRPDLASKSTPPQPNHGRLAVGGPHTGAGPDAVRQSI